MTYEEIKRNICKRMNDPDLETYRGVAGDMFVNSMCNLLMEDKYDPEDIPELFVDESQTVSFIDSEAEFTLPLNMLKFIDVYLETSDILTTNLTLKEISHEEVARIQLEKPFMPTNTECFWYRKGRKIRFILSKDFVDGEPTIWKFVILYIKNPVVSDWTTNIGTNGSIYTNLITSNGYSLDFIYNCINNTVDMLKGNQQRKAE